MLEKCCFDFRVKRIKLSYSNMKVAHIFISTDTYIMEVCQTVARPCFINKMKHVNEITNVSSLE